MRSLVLVPVFLLLAGCMDTPPPPPQQAAEPQPTILDDQLKAIDRAKAVEQDVLDAAEKQNAEIEAQGG